MKKQLLTLSLLLLCFACKQNSTEKEKTTNIKSIEDSLTTTLDSIYKQSTIVGFSVAIVNDKDILYNKGYGFADVTNNKKYTANTIQSIGSVSKTFIGISLLKAQELGKLKLDDAINQYLPFKVFNPKHPKEPITLRQLATHTSSILDTDYYAMSYVMLEEEHQQNEKVIDYFQTPDRRSSIEAYLEKVLAEDGIWNKGDSYANYKPGTQYQYSNVASTLAALVIEKATSMPFNEFTKKHILNPLNMSTSGWLESEIDLKLRSRNFINKDTLITKYQLVTYPDGGFITSTNELGTYLIELMKGKNGNGTLLSKESYTELFKEQIDVNQIPDNDDGENSGIFLEFGKRGIGHNGGDPGVITFMYFDPETNLGKIVFINTDTDDNDGVIPGLKAIWETLEAYKTKL